MKLNFYDEKFVVNDGEKGILVTAALKRGREWEIENVTLLSIVFESKTELQEEYYKHKDCLSEIAHIFYINGCTNILFPNKKYIIAIWGTRVFKIKGFLKDDANNLISDVIHYEAMKMRDMEDLMDEKQRERKIKKQSKKRYRELKSEIMCAVSSAPR